MFKFIIYVLCAILQTAAAINAVGDPSIGITAGVCVFLPLVIVFTTLAWGEYQKKNAFVVMAIRSKLVREKLQGAFMSTIDILAQLAPSPSRGGIKRHGTRLICQTNVTIFDEGFAGMTAQEIEKWLLNDGAKELDVVGSDYHVVRQKWGKVSHLAADGNVYTGCIRNGKWIGCEKSVDTGVRV